MSASVATVRSRHAWHPRRGSARDHLLAAAIACGTLAVSAAQTPARMRRPTGDDTATILASVDGAWVLCVGGDPGAVDTSASCPRSVPSIDTARVQPPTIAVAAPARLDAGIQATPPAGGRRAGKR